MIFICNLLIIMVRHFTLCMFLIFFFHCGNLNNIFMIKKIFFYLVKVLGSPVARFGGGAATCPLLF